MNEICAALGYASNRVPKSIESIYNVHAASESTPVTSDNVNFEILTPSSFQRNEGRLTSGQINRAS